MSTPTLESTTTTTVSEPKRQRTVSPYIWVWVGVVLVYLLTLVVTPNQASLTGLSAATPYIGLLAFAAVGQSLVIMQRGIDFSVVSVIILTGMILGKLSTSGMNPILAIVITLAIGAVIGLVNGLVVVYLRLTPLVATLAANGLYLGIAILLSSGAPVPVTHELEDFADSTWFGVSPILLIAIVFVAILVVLMNRTVLGRRFIASGANPLGARAAGIAVNRYALTGYSAAGFCYAATGVLISSYVGDSRLTMASDYLMTSIAAVIIGGTVLTGGRGSLVATFGGAVFMTLLGQFVLAAGVSPAVQMLIEAIVFIAAITLPTALIRARRRRAVAVPVAVPATTS
ncbi:ABC transporter permease [Subtercola endophyticus]|uniref:ABC transporter permease n=1 Tax=Subtercola endophyticus TaxID=2895559 RepID=UPI001E2E2F0E|nr:ABC transporter permease [Subtercola endophyticus]UFS58612.1 ABC transporter permease [Subtercola endophyticus]